MNEIKPSILLIEDDHMDSMDFERELRKLDVQNPFYVARNGKEAIEMLKGQGIKKIDPKPSLVVLDINMPKMDGFEFLSVISKDPEFIDLKIFILTTSDDVIDRERAREFKIEGYIVKPLTFKSFGEGGTDIDGFSLFLELLKMK